MAVNAVPEEMIVHSAPEQVQGEVQLETFRGKAFDQQFEQILNQPTNQERFGTSSPITRLSYDDLTAKMKDQYEEKYEEDAYLPGLYPGFYIGKIGDTPEQSDQKFTEAALRAQKVFDSLRMNWQTNESGKSTTRITSVISLLASLKESYIRIQDSNIKADIHRIFNLLGFHLTFFDQSEVLADCLIDSDQTPEHYQVVFTKLLADEKEAFIAGKPVLDRANQYRQQLAGYLNRVSLYLPLPKMEDITYVKEMRSFEPVGSIVQREYPRGSFRAIVNSSKSINIDPQHLTFVCVEPLPLSEIPEIDREAIVFLATVLHESIHFNGKLVDPNIETGSWQEAANELITDYATLTLMTQAGIGKGYQENGLTPDDWFKKTGYHQLIKTAFRLEEIGLMQREEIVRFGLNQDSLGFTKLLGQRLQQATSEQRQRLLNAMDSGTVIGPNQYDLLIAKSDLTTEDLIRGVLDFGQKVGSFYYLQPGTILLDIKESLSEWESWTFDQFLDWFHGKEGEFGSADRQTRHKLIRDFIQGRQKSV